MEEKLKEIQNYLKLKSDHIDHLKEHKPDGWQFKIKKEEAHEVYHLVLLSILVRKKLSK